MKSSTVNTYNKQLSGFSPGSRWINAKTDDGVTSCETCVYPKTAHAETRELFIQYFSNVPFEIQLHLRFRIEPSWASKRHIFSWL